VSASGDPGHRALVVFFEAIVLFFAGVVGNEVAELLNISATAVIISIIFIMILLYFVTVARIHNESNQGTIRSLLGQFDLRRIATIFPASAGFGAMGGFLSSLLFSRERVFAVPLTNLGPWGYELGAFIFGFLLLYLFCVHHPREGCARKVL
jgi:hypothetical protein